jgi:16S rRNA processing protein RimM
VRREDCFYLGHFSRLHGIRGELIAALDTDRPEAYHHLESVLVERHAELVPFFVEASTVNARGQLILQLEEVGPEAAPALVGASLYLPLSQLPPLSGKQFYFHEVMDWPVYRHDGALLGHVQGFQESGAQPLFQIADDQRSTPMLIPAIDAFISSVNRSEQAIYLQELPEGLLEL